MALERARLDATLTRRPVPVICSAEGRWIMGETVHAFSFEIDILGVRPIARNPLFPGCRSDGEIDTNIQLLKDDLDAVAKQMKAAIREQDKKSDFDI